MNSNQTTNSKRIVYLVTNRYLHDLHPKIENLLTLRSQFERIVVVSRSLTHNEEDHIALKTYPNPTGILSKLGMRRFKDVIDRYLYFPTTVSRLVKPAVKRMSNEIAQELSIGKSVVVMTSVPAHDLCQIGYALKKRHPQIKWIIDWRDLWSHDEYYFDRVPNLYKQRLIKLEKSCLQASDLNITTNSYAKSVLETHYNVPQERTCAIRQHYSDIDWSLHQNRKEIAAPPKTKQNKDVIKLGFLGHPFKPPRVPGHKLIQTIKKMREAGNKIELHIYTPGKSKSSMSENFEQSDGVYYHNRLSQSQNSKEVANCDFLVLLLEDLENCKAVMSLKLPQYLVMQKPILAIVPRPSAVADVILSTRSGLIIPVEEDWVTGLEKAIYQTYSFNSFESDLATIEQYSWQSVKNEWLNALNL